MKDLDQKVKTLLEKVESLKKEIGNTKSYRWKTNCMLNGVNIRVIGSAVEIAALASPVLTYQQQKEQLSKLLGVRESEMLYFGYSTEDWLADLAHRADMININEKKALLTRSQKALDNLMSEDFRRERELDALEDVLKNL